MSFTQHLSEQAQHIRKVYTRSASEYHVSVYANYAKAFKRARPLTTACLT